MESGLRVRSETFREGERTIKGSLGEVKLSKEDSTVDGVDVWEIVVVDGGARVGGF